LWDAAVLVYLNGLGLTRPPTGGPSASA